MELQMNSIKCFLFYMLFLAVSAQQGDLDDDDDEKSKVAIYYGDPEVNVGESFSITCIIQISDPIQWFKDGETIRKHNLRHGKDVHAFIESEHPIEGESDRIEAKIRVNSALEIHEGKYQCNRKHPSYHYLKVLNNKRSYTEGYYFNRSKESTIGSYEKLTTASSIPLSSIEFDITPPRIRDNKNKINTKYSHNELYDIHPRIHTVLEEYNRSRGILHKDVTSEYKDDLSTTFPGNIYYESDNNNNKNKKIYAESTHDNRANTNNKQIHVESARKILEPKSYLIPNYDNAELQIKAFDLRQPIVLSCNISKEGNYELKWEKNGTDVSKIESIKTRHRILNAERKLIIDKGEEKDAGLYSCSVNDKDLHEKKDIKLYANVVVRTPSNAGVVEGEKLTIHCLVVGTDPEIAWQYGNITIANTTDKYVLLPDDNKIPNALFTIENASLEDRGEYKCIGKNFASEHIPKVKQAEDTCYVRVKEKFAALWPFLGICIEVIILCAIIIIYERRRNKTELEESDTDPNTEQEKLKPSQRN